MTAICFVCNLPILSHQVGLVWQGGNGWDDLMREQLEESTLKARLGGRRDSSAQITTISPPAETQETSPPPRTNRRRSSLSQLTGIFWGTASRKREKRISRRETLADLAKSLPWRRDPSVDSGVKSSSSAKSKQDSEFTTARIDIFRQLNNATSRHGSVSAELYAGSHRPSLASVKDDSLTTAPSPKHHHKHSRHPHSHSRPRPCSKPDFQQIHKEESRSLLLTELSVSSHIAQQQQPSTGVRIDSSTQALPPPTIITSSVTPPSTSPSISPPCHTPLVPEVSKNSPPSRPTSPQLQTVASSGASSLTTITTAVTAVTTVTTVTTETTVPSAAVSSPTHPLDGTRRDSTTQVRTFLRRVCPCSSYDARN